MATYILLLTLTPEGQIKALDDPDYLLGAEAEIDIPSVQTLGVYAVLGDFDFVTIVEADGNDAIRALLAGAWACESGVHITTLPVVPAAQLADRTGRPHTVETIGEVPE